MKQISKRERARRLRAQGSEAFDGALQWIKPDVDTTIATVIALGKRTRFLLSEVVSDDELRACCDAGLDYVEQIIGWLAYEEPEERELLAAFAFGFWPGATVDDLNQQLGKLMEGLTDDEWGLLVALAKRVDRGARMKRA